MMMCKNIKCPYYKKPDKRDFIDKLIGVKAKNGGCKYNYCKLGGKRYVNS